MRELKRAKVTFGNKGKGKYTLHKFISLFNGCKIGSVGG